MFKFDFRLVLPCILPVCFLIFAMGVVEKAYSANIAELEERIEAYVPDRQYRDDAVGLLVVKDALVSLKEGSGGIGACLVDGKTGQVVERGRNRQYTPYFRSDRHAEMDLLNRYEDRVRKRKSTATRNGNDPRQCGELILFSSVEPCPMCLTRIINSGIQHMYYIIPDDKGGMVQHMDQLPEFWRDFAAGRDFRQADCSPALRRIAEELFSHSMREVLRKKDDVRPGIKEVESQ
jgi:tRNA(adenine34) deaminase